MELNNILTGLNPSQRDAVINYDSPSLIIAGAGSGKTRVLTTRIAYMLANGVNPENILALTFTKKAATEMKDRITKMVGPSSYKLVMGTFHAIFARILRENAEIIGYPSSFTIFDSSDNISLIKKILKDFDISEDTYKPRSIATRISLLKNQLITSYVYMNNAVYQEEDRKHKMPRFAEIYHEYCNRCKACGAMDFDDLLLQTNILFKDPGIVAKYQEIFQYILVDEYQDTNFAQYVIVRKLSDRHHRICVVGDDAQSIYSFRGANINNILSFQKDYADCKVYRLEQNYRSTQTIVNAANSIIAKNRNQLKKNCFSEGEQGDKIIIEKAYTDREEASIVVNRLQEYVRRDHSTWDNVVILYRNNSQSRVLEDMLRKYGIPYRILKGTAFYERAEVKNILAYFRLIFNPKDDEAFRRIINVPARSIGPTSQDYIETKAKNCNQSLWETLCDIVDKEHENSSEKSIKKNAAAFVQNNRFLIEQKQLLPIVEFGQEVINKSGLITHYTTQNTVEAQSAVDNINEVMNSIVSFEEMVEGEISTGEREESAVATIEEWYSNAMLSVEDPKDDKAPNKVTLMTIHSAKGLEFDNVFITGCEENLFPSYMAQQDFNQLEEERRLFYVAVTRAKKRVFLSCAETRYMNGNQNCSSPSRFLKEIDPSYIDCKFTLSSRGTSTGMNTSFTPRERVTTSSYPGYRPSSSQSQRPATPSNLKPLGTAKPINSAPSASGSFQIGDTVAHVAFGTGTIVDITIANGEEKVVIDFRTSGRKTLLTRLAKLKKI